MYSMATIANNYYTAYLKVARRVDLESSHKKKTFPQEKNACKYAW